MREDQEDSRQQVEGDEPSLLKSLMLGVFAGNVIVSLEFGGLFGVFGSALGVSSISIWQSLLTIVAGGCAFGVVLGIAWYWVGGLDNFKGFCFFLLAGGAAGTAAWMIVQPETSLLVAVGVSALFSGLYFLVGLKFG